MLGAQPTPWALVRRDDIPHLSLYVESSGSDMMVENIADRGLIQGDHRSAAFSTAQCFVFLADREIYPDRRHCYDRRTYVLHFGGTLRIVHEPCRTPSLLRRVDGLRVNRVTLELKRRLPHHHNACRAQRSSGTMTPTVPDEHVRWLTSNLPWLLHDP